MCVRAHQYYGVHVEVRGRLSCLHVTLGIEHRLAGSTLPTEPSQQPPAFILKPHFILSSLAVCPC